MAAQRMGNFNGQQFSPQAPPFPGLMTTCNPCKRFAACDCCMVTNAAREMWDKLFIEGYQSDVFVRTNEGTIPAHASILGMASPVMRNMLKQKRSRGGCRKVISIRGVPHHAVRVFLRFLYSSCYEQDEMNQFVLHLLVLSHVFVITKLKKVCVEQLERGLLTTENVVDVFQLARLVDASRLDLLCHRMIVKNFKEVAATEGWMVMKQSNPRLEKKLLKSVVEADTRKKERLRRLEERKIYLQLHEAMEALVHICRDGCRTIGPHDKVLRRSATPCDFPACRGLEALVRHFAGCKKRVLGGCTHCKRMWQLLELHSRLCPQVDGCKVPLCRHFKEKSRHQNKKDEVKWKLLVSKVLEAKNLSGAPFQQSMVSVCAHA